MAVVAGHQQSSLSLPAHKAQAVVVLPCRKLSRVVPVRICVFVCLCVGVYMYQYVCVCACVCVVVARHQQSRLSLSAYAAQAVVVFPSGQLSRVVPEGHVCVCVRLEVSVWRCGRVCRCVGIECVCVCVCVC